jgi:hypothetical protein
MIVREIVSRNELFETMSWYEAHGQATPNSDWFGKGYWIPGVAAAFVYETDGPRVYIEDVVTNLDASPKMRHEALEKLLSFVVAQSARRGYKYIVGWSRESDIAKRAADDGFTEIGKFEGFALRIGGE